MSKIVDTAKKVAESPAVELAARITVMTVATAAAIIATSAAVNAVKKAAE